MSALTRIRALTRLVGLDPGRFVLTVALGVLTVLTGAALLGLSGLLICRAAQQPAILTLGTLMVAVRAVALVRPGARYAERLSGHDLAFRSLGRLRAVVFTHLEPLAPAELEAYRDGELLGRLVGDVDELQDLVLRVLLPVSIGVPAAAVVVTVAAWWSPPAAAVLGAGLLLAATVPPAVARTVTLHSRERQADRRAVLTADLVDALGAAPELWLNGADGRVAESLAVHDRALVAAGRRDASAAGAADAITLVLTGLTALAVLVVTTAAVGRGALDPLAVAPLTLVALAAFEAVGPFGAAARQLPSVLDAGDRVLDLMARSPRVVDPAEPLDPPGRAPALELDAVVVTRGAEATRVLDGLDLELTPGIRVAVRGPSGAGKSTMLLVLSRFLERDAGNATAAGHDLRAYAQADLRHEVLLLQQDPHVFNSDLRENVAFARPGADDAAIHAALERARLGDWVASLPDGLDTRVGEHGRSLSGGQRQRLSLARAFLADPSVLLLDEPTAHLDDANAAALLAVLADQAGDRTVVLVAHGRGPDQAPDESDTPNSRRASAAADGHDDEHAIVPRGFDRALTVVDGRIRRPTAGSTHPPT